MSKKKIPVAVDRIERPAVEEMYTHFLSGELQIDDMEGLLKELSETAAEMEKKLSEGSMNEDDLARYEEAAQHYGFYAGFMTALWMKEGK